MQPCWTRQAPLPDKHSLSLIVDPQSLNREAQSVMREAFYLNGEILKVSGEPLRVTRQALISICEVPKVSRQILRIK
jgi:hypothetical protein